MKHHTGHGDLVIGVAVGEVGAFRLLREHAKA